MPAASTDPDDIFTAGQTRGIARFAAGDILCSSDALGWTRLHVSHQQEQPFSGCFAARAAHLFVLHRQGRAQVELACGDDRVSGAVGPGVMSVLPGGVAIGLRLHGPVETIHLSLRAPVGDGFPTPTPTPAPAPSPALGQDNPALFQLTEVAADMMYAGCGDGLAGSVAQMLAAELVDQSGVRRRARFAAWQFHHVYHFIRRNIDRPLRLEDLAQVAGISGVHFARRFREGTGWAPHQFLIGLRLAVARGLLKGGDPIAQIAAHCGFANQEHMTRLFRQWLGITPAAWRRQVAAQGQPGQS